MNPTRQQEQTDSYQGFITQESQTNWLISIGVLCLYQHAKTSRVRYTDTKYLYIKSLNIIKKSLFKYVKLIFLIQKQGTS